MSPLSIQRLSEAAPAEPLLSQRTWPDTWPIFLGGLAASIAGVTLWRIELATEKRKRIAALSQAQDSPSHRDVVRLMLDSVSHVEALAGQSGELQASQLCERIDAVLNELILPIVNDRTDVLNRFGMSHGSEMLIALAYGERMLNRAWSAAADGYLEEARDSVSESVEGFHEMQRLLEAQGVSAQ